MTSSHSYSDAAPSHGSGGSGARPTVGCSVYLTADHEDYGDAGGGPLTLGIPGTLVEDDASSKPFKVKAPDGKEWWYAKEALTTVRPAGARATPAATGRLKVGEMVTLHSNFGST